MFVVNTHSSLLSSLNMNSGTGEAAKEDMFKNLGTRASAWETAKKFRVPHLEEE